MKSLVVCVSKSHGNTRRVAERIAAELGAEVVEPEAVDVDTLADYDLVGFGSGIYFWSADPRLQQLVDRLPHATGGRAFTFFTSGSPDLPFRSFTNSLRNRLRAKGFDILGSFDCRGFDSVGPLRIIGGLNKGRPNSEDLDRAAGFAARLRRQVSTR